jgi:hypothetical protein
MRPRGISDRRERLEQFLHSMVSRTPFGAASILDGIPHVSLLF